MILPLARSLVLIASDISNSPNLIVEFKSLIATLIDSSLTKASSLAFCIAIPPFNSRFSNLPLSKILSRSCLSASSIFCFFNSGSIDERAIILICACKPIILACCSASLEEASKAKL